MIEPVHWAAKFYLKNIFFKIIKKILEQEVQVLIIFSQLSL